MAGTGSSNLRVNNRSADVSFYGKSDFTAPRLWAAHVNMVQDYDDIFPNNQQTGTPGAGYVTLEVPYNADVLNKMVLYFTRTAFQTTKATFIRPVDWEGIQCIDNIDFQFGGRSFFTLTGRQLLPDLLQKKTLAQRTALGYLLGGNYSQGERNGRTGPQDYVYELPVPWNDLQKPVVMSALPQKIVVKIKFLPTERWTESDAVGAACTFTQMFLRCYSIHYEDTVALEKFNMTRDNQGLQYKISTIESHLDVLIPAGTKKFRWQLKNLKNNVFNIRTTLIRKADRDGPYAKPANWLLCDTIRLQDGGTDIIKPVEPKTTGLYVTNPVLYPEGAVGVKITNIPLCPWEYVEHSDYDCFGGRTMSRYGNPEMVLEFNEATTEDLYLDIEGLVHNILVQIRGDVRIMYL